MVGKLLILYSKSDELSVRLGVTLGILWALNVFLMPMMTSIINVAPFYKAISAIYPGCQSGSFGGRLLCTAAAFADLFSLGFLIGVIYNRLPIKL